MANSRTGAGAHRGCDDLAKLDKDRRLAENETYDRLGTTTGGVF